MIYTVIGHTPNKSDIQIKDQDGHIYLVDLFVDNTFNEAPTFETIAQRNEYCQSLIGKQIEIVILYPYSYIASNIKLVDDKPKIETCDHHYIPTNAKWQSATQRECCHCGHIID